MEENKELDIDIEDIGTILKSSRLKSKKSMEEISSELCIRKIYLTALEEGDYETLPPIPYGIGYVRTYAAYLGLSPERAVKLYKDAAMTEDKEETLETEVRPEAEKSGSWHIFAGILAVIVIYGAWSFYARSVNNTTKAAKVAVSLSEVENEKVSEPVSSESDIQEIAAPEEMPTEEPTVSAMTPLPEMPPEKEAPSAGEVEEYKVPNTVVLEFTGESWVELKDKNKVYFQGVYHDGDKKEIDYVDNLFLSVGRPQNVKVLVKGEEKNITARRRKMNIPLDTLE